MSITLRRKMFKLGGRANTHGMGLTSGLKMKKGGPVQASIGAGSGNQPMKMGPDGQMREGHVLPILPLLGSGLATAGRFGLKALAPGARSLISAIRSPGGIRSLINRPVMKDAVKGKGFVMGTPTAPGTGLKALRGTGLGLAGLGLGTGGPLALGSLLNTDDTSPRIARAAESLGEFALDYSPAGLIFSLGDFALGKPGQDTRSLTEALGLKKKKEDTAKTETRTQDFSTLAKEATQDTQAEAKKRTNDRVEELYKQLGGKGVNKLAALGAGLTAAAAPLLEEDYGAAAAAFSQGMAPEIQRDRDLKDAAAQLAIAEEADVRASDRAMEQAEKAADLEALMTLDTPALVRRERLTKAFAEMGDQVIELPVKIKKGKASLDEEKLVANRIYTDTSGIFQQTYLATNSAKEKKAFNDLQSAIKFASA